MWERHLAPIDGVAGRAPDFWHKEDWKDGRGEKFASTIGIKLTDWDGISIAPHTVGAVSNRTGPYGNQCHESSSVERPSMNGFGIPSPMSA